MPTSLLHSLAPIVCDETRSDQVLISSETVPANTETRIPVDSSVKKLMFEITGPNIDYVTIFTPTGTVTEDLENVKVDFENLRYYVFTNVSVGDWRILIQGDNDHEYRVTASALAAINFEYSFESDQISGWLRKTNSKKKQIESPGLGNDPEIREKQIIS